MTSSITTPLAEIDAPQVAVNDIGSEEDFLAAIDETIKYFNDGDIVDGTIVKVDRRAKYLLFRLGDGQIWLGHLGMTGAFRFADARLSEPSRYHAAAPKARHDHVEIDLVHPKTGALQLIYADPRRFGFMDLFADEAASPHLRELGPEPLGNGFSAETLAARRTMAARLRSRLREMSSAQICPTLPKPTTASRNGFIDDRSSPWQDGALSCK